MRQASVRRKVQELQGRVVTLREEVAVLSEQIEVIDDEVEELRVRAVVSETPLAVREHAEASRHAELAHRARKDALEQMVKVEAERDELLRAIGVEAGN